MKAPSKILNYSIGKLTDHVTIRFASGLVGEFPYREAMSIIKNGEIVKNEIIDTEDLMLEKILDDIELEAYTQAVLKNTTRSPTPSSGFDFIFQIACRAWIAGASGRMLEVADFDDIENFGTEEISCSPASIRRNFATIFNGLSFSIDPQLATYIELHKKFKGMNPDRFAL